ncbi:MAG TPA: ABC transporter substrate-binding protein [Chloroflexota bacterium]
MKRRHRALGVLLAVGILLSLALTFGAIGSTASGSHRAAHAKQSGKNTARQVATTSKGSRCAKRTRASGTLKYSDWQFPDTLNPYQSTLAVSQETWNATLESLFVYNNRAQLVPQLASTIPTVKNGGIRDGGRTIVIHLKGGLHWSNGAAITSQDIKFGWEVGMDKATGPYCSGSCDVIDRITTPSKLTALIHLRRVYAPVLAYGMPPVWPAKWAGVWNNNAHVAAVKLGQDPSFTFEGTNYPTNGAYQVSQFIKDDRIVLHPMKYYSNANCGAAVQNLIFAFYSDKAPMIAAAASRATDVTQNYTAADLASLRQHANAYRLSTTPSFSMEHIEFNLDSTYNGRPNPLANTNVRQALALSLDKIGMIRGVLNVSKSQALGVAAWTPFVNTPSLVQPFAERNIKGQWDPIARRFVAPGTAQALKDAKKLLARTPYKNGFTLDFSTTSGNQVRATQLAIAQESWKKIGVNVTPYFIPATTYFADYAHDGTLVRGNFQVGMWGYNGSPDPDQWKYNMVSSYIDRRASVHAAINENDAGIRDTAIDKAFTAAARSLSHAVRAKNYATVQNEINKKSYWIPLYFKPQIATADSNVIHFSNNPTQVGPTWNMVNWRAKAS